MTTFLNYPLPLWAFILLWIGLTLGIIWFVWLVATERKSRLEADALLKQAENALEVGPTELQELNHDYAALSTLLEDHTQQFADVQKELFSLDERLSRLEQRSTHIHIGISKLFQVCDDEEDDEDDDDQDSDVLTLPRPDWLDNVKGLDEL